METNQKAFRIFVNGYLWATKKIYSWNVETRKDALDSASHMFGNVTGKNWREKGGEKTKIDFSGGPVTYDEWREWQSAKHSIDFFSGEAILQDENGTVIARERLASWEN